VVTEQAGSRFKSGGASGGEQRAWHGEDSESKANT
jgi:hypothetical protein